MLLDPVLGSVRVVVLTPLCPAALVWFGRLPRSGCVVHRCEVDPAAVTITPLHAKAGVSGAVDPKRTRVTLNGRPARATDLQVSFSAKGEMGLDDVWVSIQAESR